jgi:hypothetical protein
MLQVMKEQEEKTWENHFAIFGKAPGEEVIIFLLAKKPISLWGKRQIPVEEKLDEETQEIENLPPGSKIKIDTLQLQITINLHSIKKEIDSLIS